MHLSLYAETPRAFLSYARSDGEAFARDLGARLLAEGVALWRDREGMEGGRDWWLQIVEALDKVEVLVLVMTPAALRSTLVRREWSAARQRGVSVYPVIATADLDFDALPRWMRSVHFYNLEFEWSKFHFDLNHRAAPRRVPFMAEDMPSDHVPRREEYERLLPLLLDRERGDPIAVTTALRGAGGYGKTALARAICHDEDVRAAFDDGILWVTLGAQPGNLVGRVEDLIFMLSGKRPGFAGLDAVTATLVDLLEDRDVLIVIDDVWDGADARPFLQGGPRCARLITTRMVDALPAGTRRVEVDAMRRDEAAALLGHGLPAGQENALAALAQRLGKWPLLLKLVNGALRERVIDGAGQPLADALAFVSKALDKRGLTYFDARDTSSRNGAVAKTLGLSLAQLDDSERARLEELAVFGEDQVIPVATVERWWQHTGGLDEIDVESLCDRLGRLSLLLSFDPTGRALKLHDVIRQFLLTRIRGREAALHAALLEALRPATGDWAELGKDEPYLWGHLAEHLVAAGRMAEFRALVLDLRYLAAKTHARHAYAAETDLRSAEQLLPGDTEIAALRAAFVQCQHLLLRDDSLATVQATLHSRLLDVAPLASVVRAADTRATKPRLEPLRPLPDLPHPAIVRTLAQVASELHACAISPDGRIVACAGNDARIRLVDALTGVECGLLLGHTGWVRRLAFAPDGKTLASAGFDRRVRLWDVASGAQTLLLKGHTDGVTDCAFLPQSGCLLSTALDDTIRLWNLSDGAPRLTLARTWQSDQYGFVEAGEDRGHWAAVLGCAVSPDGRRLASASADQTLRLWDCASGEQLLVLSGHEAAVNACAFAPDGLRLASAGADGMVRIWDLVTGATVATLAAHEAEVKRCLFLPDGLQLVSASTDGTLILWNLTTGVVAQRLTGHTGGVNDCALSADGKWLASAASDGSLRLWSTPVGADDQARRPLVQIKACAVARDAPVFAFGHGDGQLSLHQVDRPEAMATIAAHVREVRACGLSRDAKLVVSGGADGDVCVWNANDGSLVARLKGHRDAVNACTFNASASLIASASDDRTLRLWDRDDRARRLAFVAHSHAVSACAFSPDGAFVVSGAVDGSLRRWSVPADESAWEHWFAQGAHIALAAALQRFEMLELPGHQRAVNHAAYADDGSFIVSASDDRTLRLWETLDGKEGHVLRGHRSAVRGLSIHPQGQRIASVSAGGELRIWQVADGRCIAALQVEGALAQCAWIGNDSLLAVGFCGAYFLRCIG